MIMIDENATQEELVYELKTLRQRIALLEAVDTGCTQSLQEATNSSNIQSQMEKEWLGQKHAERCIAALERNNINGYYVKDCEEARAKLLDLIPEGATIGAGSSVTIAQTGIMGELEKRGCHVFHNPFWKDSKDTFPPIETVLQDLDVIGKKALLADVFITGTNAITLDGKIVNIDGFGNRVAPMIFGPDKVLIVSGVNKIVANVDDALKRIKEVAAPMNSLRLEKTYNYPPSPCGITSICVDCRKDIRHCMYTVIIEYQALPRIEVILVGEDLGL